MRSLAKHLATVGAFVENLSRKERPTRPALCVLKNVVLEAFHVIVAGVTASSIMLAMNAQEFVMLMVSLQQIDTSVFPTQMMTYMRSLDALSGLPGVQYEANHGFIIVLEVPHSCITIAVRNSHVSKPNGTTNTTIS